MIIRKQNMPPRIKANRRKKNTKLNQLPFQEIQNPFKPMELISADQIEFIHKPS
jgi:trimethylamine:corrinoid methyltransferase-like protein